MDDPRIIPDDRLLARIEGLAKEERERLPFFLACLGEADRRGLPVQRGYSSTFDYCVRRLKLSESESYRRISAARAAASRPELLSALADGQLSLSAVSLIAPHVRRDDAAEIISRAEGKSTRELEGILAPLSPEPPRKDRIRSVAVVDRSDQGPGAPAVRARVEFMFQGSPLLRDAIERAKELLAHKYPFGELDRILLEILEDYLERHDPQTALRLGRAVPAKGNASIPTAVRRAVWARDGGRCSFVGADGIRCTTRRMLEFDHRRPRARGGSDAADNLRLLCRPHNDSERRRCLGEGTLSTNSSREEFVDNSLGLFD